MKNNCFLFESLINFKLVERIYFHTLKNIEILDLNVLINQKDTSQKQKAQLSLPEVDSNGNLPVW